MDFLIIFAVLAIVVEGSRMAVKKYCANRPNKLAINAGLKEGLLKDADCINDENFGINELEVCTCPCCEHRWGTKAVDRVDTDSQEQTDLEVPMEKEINGIGDYVPPALPALAEGKGKRIVDEEQGIPNGHEDFRRSEEVESLRESKDRKTSAKIFPLPTESELQAEAVVQKQRPDYNFMRSGSGLGSHHYGLNHSPLSSGEISDIPGYVGSEEGREDGQGQGGGHEEDHEEKEMDKEGKEEEKEKKDKDKDVLTCQVREEGIEDGQGQEGHEEGHEKAEETDKKDKERKENQLSLSSWPATSEGDGLSPVQTPPGVRVMSSMRGVVDMASTIRSLSKNKRTEEKKEKKDKDKKKGKDDEGDEKKEKKDKDKKDKDEKKEKKKDKADEGYEKKEKKDKVKKGKKYKDKDKG